MTSYTATYSPEDNKLRLYASARLDKELYTRVRAHGFIWAPRQELFVAPSWSPERADLLEELAGDIEDEDKSLVERAEERAERFDEYSDKRAADSARASAAVRKLADGIPLGQPILVGHHSEKHARKDAQRIENGMRKAVKMWETSKYWTDRAAGALANAAHKERPAVRARRIKKIEAAARKMEKSIAESNAKLRIWADPISKLRRKDGTPVTLREAVIFCANYDGGYYSQSYKRASGYEGPIRLWEAAGGNIEGRDPEEVAIATPEEVQAKAIADHTRYNERRKRWLDHYNNRLAYERAMLADSGGTATDKTGPEVGGAVRSLWSPERGAWAYIQKVNKVTLTLWHTYNRGSGRVFRQKVPLTDVQVIMSKAEVEAASSEGRVTDICEGEKKLGFRLAEPAPTKEDNVCPDGPTCPDTECKAEREKQGLSVVDMSADIAAMRQSLKAGITVAAVPQLFPTPRELAERVAELADVSEGCAVLEPSAGAGALLGAIGCRWYETGGKATAIEINAGLCQRLRSEFPLTDVVCADFLECDVFSLGQFDRIVMNPPFKDGADIKHITHAVNFLKPGGRIVAICADGPRQNDTLKPMAEKSGGTWEQLPPDSFAGTGVRTALLVIEG